MSSEAFEVTNTVLKCLGDDSDSAGPEADDGQPKTKGELSRSSDLP